MMTFLDGGFGTMIQAAGLPAGCDPCDWNLERPEVVTRVHRAYVDAGAEIVLANTFGANRLKYHGANDLAEIVSAAVSCARAAGASRVALDLGPTGRLLAPAGDLAFEAAYEAFAETVRAGQGADLIFIETMGDLYEVKAAVLAAKENSSLPVYVTVALGENGKLLTGGSVAAVATLLESLDVAAYGFNCGLGPDRMLPYVKELAQLSTKPIIVKPNAGMPRLENGRTVFAVGPEEFAADVRALVEAGASIVGGCCGTTPDHLSAVVSDLRNPPARKAPAALRVTRVSSGSTVVELKSGEGLVIGERINPTGKKLLQAAYRSGDVAYVLREAVRQIDAGAAVLDVNCGVPGLDEAALLESTVTAVQSVAVCPVQIDTADAKALARALRRVNGRPLVNSVTGARASMDAVFPLVRRYGGVIVGLCLDDRGVPPTVEERLAIARRILEEGARYGFTKEDFVFDALTLAVSAEASAACVTLETVRRLTQELGVNTVLGVSNVSFGLPNRSLLNNTMYALAKRAGLSAAIANPSLIRDEIDPAAEDVLMGRDENCARWIAAQTAAAVSASPSPEAAPDASARLRAAIRSGLGADASAAAKDCLSTGMETMTVVNGSIVPALEEVGRGFEKGVVFLPQLLKAADAAGAAFDVLRAAMAVTGEAASRRPIVLATVKGDVHDIGKNIVRALLENYGFRVIDLGRDVEPARIVSVARAENAFLIGLSALMTTTVGAMEETIRQARQAGLAAKVVVGGAVVTSDFAQSIGADFYGGDAMRTVRIAEGLVNPGAGGGV